MLIVCKTCASSYHIPQEILGDDGCRLRCVGCGDIWAVSPQASMADGAPIVEGERVLCDALEPAWRRARHRGALFSGEPSSGWLEERASRRRGGFLSSLRSIKKLSTGVRAGIAALSIVACAMAAVAARAAIVKAVPSTARIFAAVGLPVNLRGLALDNVRTNIFDLGDRKILVVEGAVVNLRDSAMETPNMRIVLRDADKREIYVWTAPAPRAKLEPNEQIAFRTRLAAPPDGVKDVLVKFASVGDKPSPMKDGL